MNDIPLLTINLELHDQFGNVPATRRLVQAVSYAVASYRRGRGLIHCVSTSS